MSPVLPSPTPMLKDKNLKKNKIKKHIQIQIFVGFNQATNFRPEHLLVPW